MTIIRGNKIDNVTYIDDGDGHYDPIKCDRKHYLLRINYIISRQFFDDKEWSNDDVNDFYKYYCTKCKKFFESYTEID